MLKPPNPNRSTRRLDRGPKEPRVRSGPGSLQHTGTFGVILDGHAGSNRGRYSRRYSPGGRSDAAFGYQSIVANCSYSSRAILHYYGYINNDINYNRTPAGIRCIAIAVSISTCPLAYFKNHKSKLVTFSLHVASSESPTSIQCTSGFVDEVIIT